MDWLEEVQGKLKRRNQVLFSKDSPPFQELKSQMEHQTRRGLVLRALDLAEETVRELEHRYLGDDRPRQALDAARHWSEGTVKMPLAQRAILDCHGLAREFQDPADIARCHAVGQACSVIHTPGHALGHPIYELTALVRSYGPDLCRGPVEELVQYYVDQFLFWQEHLPAYQGGADFLCR